MTRAALKAARAARAQARAQTPAYEPPQGVIVAPSAYLSDSVAACHDFQLIAARGCDDLVYRPGVGLALLTHCLRRVKPLELRSVLGSYAAPGMVMAWKVAGGSREVALRPHRMTEPDARALMEAVVGAGDARCAAEAYLPTVRFLADAPVLMLDRRRLKLITRPGLDLKTGVFVTGAMKLPRMTWRQGVRRLCAALQHYRTRAAADRSRLIAAVLTPALKRGGFIKGYVPATLLEADRSQTGKTQAARFIVAIYTADDATTVTQAQGGVDTLEAQLTAAIADGAAAIILDNARGHLDLPRLEAMLTGGERLRMRDAYGVRTTVDATCTPVILTSNGASMTPDLANRLSVVSLVRQPDGYRFPARLPAQDARENRASLLAAVYAVIGEWVKRGRRRTGARMDVFTEWAGVLDWIVQKLFELPPLREGAGQVKARLGSPGLSFVRDLARSARHWREQWRLAHEVAELCVDHSITVPGSGGNQDARAVGKAFGMAFNGCEEREEWGGALARLDADDISVWRFTREEQESGRHQRAMRYYMITAGTRPTSPPDGARLPGSG